MKGILGKKIGMTQLYDKQGALVPVTLIEAGPCTVLGVKPLPGSVSAKIKLGFEDKKETRVNKPDLGNFKKSRSKPKSYVREILFGTPEGYKEGQDITIDIFQEGEFVDITGISKGKGFQGGMKRWNWTAGKSGHGSTHHRQPGSIGASSFPSRVVKGHHLPGHMGLDRVTAQNLEVIKVDKDQNILVVKGTIPGHNNSFITVRSAKKKHGTAKQEKAKAI